ncbi:uncharacterized protein LOC135138639 [Zophobas morio]|uniref:uncharacterized protein LOC135138639 n=1 Tax=Zophobas morio TaxID=2755281 RepID=UPI003083E810
MPKLLNFDPSYAHLGRTKPTVHGLDGFILKTIAEYVNFSIDLVGGFGEENFGFGLPNGTITGSLGVIANGEAQISANGRFIMDYDTTAIEFTVPYDTDKMCPVVPKSKMIPNWLNSFHCFTTRTWLALYSTFCICIVLWYFIGPTRKHLQVWWEMYAIFRGIPVKIRPTLAQGFFLFWCMAFSVIILTLVQASFFNFFTHPLFYQEIDTLEELDQSNLPIATNFYQFDSDGSELMANLKKKRIRYLSNFMSVVAYNRNLALLERKRDVDSIIKTQYLSPDGTPLLHVVNECFTSYFISYIVPRGSALLNIFDVILLRLVESGLTSKWYQDVEYSITTEELMNLNHRKKLWRAFNLFDLQAAFFLWVSTHATSLCYRPVPAMFGVRSTARVRTTNVRVAGATLATISFAPQHDRALYRWGGGRSTEAAQYHVDFRYLQCEHYGVLLRLRAFSALGALGDLSHN